MPVIQIATAFNIDLAFEAAPFHRRLFAYLIDLTLMVVYLFSMKYFLYAGFGLSTENNVGIDILFISLPMLLYSVLTEIMMNGQTVGKKIMQLRVVSLDGKEPDSGQFVLRWITKVFEWPFLFGYIFFSIEAMVYYLFMTCFLGLGAVFLILITAKKQRLGDIVAGTAVVNTRTKLSVHDTVFMDVVREDYKVMFPEVMRLSDNDINTIKKVLLQVKKRNNYDLASRVSYKIQDVLQIQSHMQTDEFLEKLLEDYNYLATRE
ncbi:MAG: RDD family protein [Ferruginibacter sp.]